MKAHLFILGAASGALTVICGAAGTVSAQDLKTKDVPATVRAALAKRNPEATKVSWEKEKGNYEANWGGRSGEDHSVQFSPAGDFVEEVDAMAAKDLPAPVGEYIKEHYHSSIREAGRRVDAKGAHTYEVEVKGKDLLFTTEGVFLSEERE